ncbi:hypothetical protein [Paucibacter sp. DJ2R-2]|uniref:hypothetical protein n=1 Tax=Paucibacter sp. DJ2R-2 TaxID=2893558 RepID=UPI0021E45757|nr:hypothetical protein [Paucibacter sp. DJ2R-2]MCV2439849.1 hypothetical protein [Paucibacter sp. DJ2R-2]
MNVQAMNRLRQYLSTQFQPFDRAALWSSQVAKEGALIVFWWAVPSFLFVWLVSRFRDYLPAAYLESAISEGIGPHLWNVVGTLGLVLVGFALLFPRSRLIARSAYYVLINTNAIGGLSFGLLFGQLFTRFAASTKNLALWKVWLMGAGGVCLAIQVLALNFSLWYLGHLMATREASDGFLHRVERIDFPLRLFAFLFFGTFPVILLFMEK